MVPVPALQSFARLDHSPTRRPTLRMLEDQRYVVGWPSIGVVKIGSTFKGKQRWGPFLARGGVMLDLAVYENAVEAEACLQRRVAALYPRAFQAKVSAQAILGNGGAGYLECYSVPTDEWAFIVRIAREA